MERLSFEVLKNPSFRLLVLTRMLALTAMQAQAVIVGWQIYEITGSVFMLGLTGLAEALPALACALFAGHIVDNNHPAKVYVLCLSGLAVNVLMLAVFAGGLFNVGNTALLGIIFTAIIVAGFIRSFIFPSAFSLLPLIVARKDFSAANSWQTAGQQVAFIGGPTVAGLIYGAYGAEIAWIFALCMIVTAAFAAFMIRAPLTRDPARKRLPALQSISEGWTFLMANRALLSVMALDMLAVLLGGAMAILPAFADQVLGVGAEGLGLLRASPAIGAILTALWFALRPMQLITARRMLIVVAGFGFCMVGFGFSTSLLAAVFFLALSGAFDSVSMVIRGTLMQVLTPENMKGRISSVNSMFIISSNELGAFQSGVAAAAFGLVPSIILGGFGTLGVVAGVAVLSPSFRKMRVDLAQSEKLG